VGKRGGKEEVEGARGRGEGHVSALAGGARDFSETNSLEAFGGQHETNTDHVAACLSVKLTTQPLNK